MEKLCCRQKAPPFFPTAFLLPSQHNFYQHIRCQRPLHPVSSQLSACTEKSLAGKSQKPIPVRNKPLWTFYSSADPADRTELPGAGEAHSTGTSPSIPSSDDYVPHLTGSIDAQIQLISGHESKKSLEIYQHLSLSAVEQAYQEAIQGVSI
jgi:hypothetical protein